MKILNISHPGVRMRVDTDKAVYIGRGDRTGLPRSEWANAFAITGTRTRSQAIEEYRGWLYKRLVREPGAKQRLLQLDGKDLACHCAPSACHGDVIVRAIKWLKGETITKIFVFGSNLAGRHGKGAALYARDKYNAQYGVGTGRTGDAYAIPTKDERLRVLPLNEIQKHVANFIVYARMHTECTFFVTRIGCGLAGYKDSDIAPMFEHAPSNCIRPEGW